MSTRNRIRWSDTEIEYVEEQKQNTSRNRTHIRGIEYVEELRLMSTRSDTTVAQEKYQKYRQKHSTENSNCRSPVELHQPDSNIASWRAGAPTDELHLLNT